ncbi:hypothetical protein BaRGS_00028637, partial [Batillaria attramentaria]
FHRQTATAQADASERPCTTGDSVPSDPSHFLVCRLERFNHHACLVPVVFAVPSLPAGCSVR